MMHALRMHCAGYSQRVIAKSLHCSRDAVSLCLKRVKEREITLPVPEKVTNAELKMMLHNTQQGMRNPDYLLPDFETIMKELKKAHVTNGLLWTEYLIQCKSASLKPYSISQFNALLREYTISAFARIIVPVKSSSSTGLGLLYC